MDLKMITGTYKLKMILDTLPAKNFKDRVARKSFLREFNLTGESDFIRKGYVPDMAPSMGDVNQQFNDGERSRVVQITTGALDRDNEVVRPDGAILSQYAKNPVVLFAHKYDMMPVGKAVWIKSNDKGLIAKTMYNKTKLADDIYENAKAGFPLAVSVGFVPVSVVRNGQSGFKEQVIECISKGWLNPEDSEKVKTIYTKWIMLEYSDVPVPSNPEAVQLAISKGWIAEEPINKDTVIVEDESPVLKPEPEETDSEIRIRVKDPDLFEQDSFRRIAIKEDKPRVYAIIGKLKGETTTTVQAYRFLKDDGWTMAEAVKWVAEHETNKSDDNLINAKTMDADGNMSISEIWDALCGALIEKYGHEMMWWIADIFPVDYPNGHVVVEVDEKYMDFPYTIDEESGKAVLGEPAQVEEIYQPKVKNKSAMLMFPMLKEGRVLSGKNRAAVQAAIDALQQVLDASIKADKALAAPSDSALQRGHTFKIALSTHDAQPPQTCVPSLTEQQVEILKRAFSENLKNIFSGERENLLRIVNERIALATGKVLYKQ